MNIKSLSAAVLSITLAACGSEGVINPLPTNPSQSVNPTNEVPSTNPPQSAPAAPVATSASHEQITRRFENHPLIQSGTASGDRFDFRSQQVTQVRETLTGKGVTVSISDANFSSSSVAVTSENTFYAFCTGGRLGVASDTDNTFVNNGLTSDSSNFFNTFNSADESFLGYWDVADLTTTLEDGQIFNGIVLIPMIDVSQFPDVLSQNLPYPSPGQQDVVTGGLVLTDRGEALAILPVLFQSFTALNAQGLTFAASDQELFPFVDPSSICGRI